MTEQYRGYTIHTSLGYDGLGYAFGIEKADERFRMVSRKPYLYESSALDAAETEVDLMISIKERGLQIMEEKLLELRTKVHEEIMDIADDCDEDRMRALKIFNKMFNILVDSCY